MHDRIGLERHASARSTSSRDRRSSTPASMCAVVDPVAQRAAGGRQLDPRVDTLRLAGIRRDVDGNTVPCVDEVAHGVGQVQLALRVARLQPVERRPQQIGPEDVDRRVHLADRELLGGRVDGLDDRLEVAVGVADDAAVAPDVGRHEREHGRRRAAACRCVATSASSSSVVSSGVSPERTRTSSAPSSASRALRTASPVPSGRSWTATVTTRRTRRPCRARRRRRAARARAGAPPRPPSPPCAGRGADGGASARPSACACRGLRP